MPTADTRLVLPLSSFHLLFSAKSKSVGFQSTAGGTQTVASEPGAAAATLKPLNGQQINFLFFWHVA